MDERYDDWSLTEEDYLRLEEIRRRARRAARYPFLDNYEEEEGEEYND